MVNLTPHTAKRQLGANLTRLREQAGKTQEDVVASNVCKMTTLRAIENGKTPGAVKKGTVSALLDVYGVGFGEEREYLKSLADDTTTNNLYGGFHQGIRLFLDLEISATSISSYIDWAMSGYLQTPQYMRAITKIGRQFTPPADANTDFDKLESNRVIRTKAMLARLDDGLTMHHIINFSTLMQCVGGEDVMREQIAWLRELDEHPNLTLSVLPPWAGAHGCQRRSLIILGFNDPRDPTVVFEESGTHKPTYLDSPESEIQRHLRMFADSAERSLPMKEYLDEHAHY